MLLAQECRNELWSYGLQGYNNKNNDINNNIIINNNNNDNINNDNDNNYMRSLEVNKGMQE